MGSAEPLWEMTVTSAIQCVIDLGENSDTLLMWGLLSCLFRGLVISAGSIERTSLSCTTECHGAASW